MFDKANEILQIKRKKDTITERYLHYMTECVKMQATIAHQSLLIEEAAVAAATQAAADEAAADEAAYVSPEIAADAADVAAMDEAAPAEATPAEDVNDVMEQASVA